GGIHRSKNTRKRGRSGSGQDRRTSGSDRIQGGEKVMDFSNFIRPYLITIYQIVTTEGRYEGGIWVPGSEERVPFKAAVVPFNDDMLQFGEAGTYTDNDRRIFTFRKL